MKNDNGQPGRKTKDANNKDLINGNGTDGLRKSTGESASSSSPRKQTTSIPSTNNRKSERLEKQVPVTKKSEKVGNQATPSPLRRSDRGKKQNSSSSPGSEKFENAKSNLKNNKGDVMEPVEVNKCQPVVNKRKRMDGRSYKALFTEQRRRIIASVDVDDDKDVEQPSKLSEVEINRGGNIDAEEVDECIVQIAQESIIKATEVRSDSSLRNSNKETTIHNVEQELSFSSSKHNDPSYRGGVQLSKNDIDKNTLNVEEMVVLDCSKEDELRSMDLVELCFKVQRGEPDAAGATGLDEKCESILQGKKTPLECQMNVNEATCIVCKNGGKLMCCHGKGCKNSYHISCLNPQIHDPPIGIWHCNQCVMKKIKKGVYSISKGIESIWDFREVEVSDVPGCQKQKQYFVKYQGLAHLHNKWIPESQLLLEAPLLVTNYKLKDKDVKWSADWTVPYRLLKKRPIMPPEERNQHLGAETLSCHYEWLVKWRGLDYEDCTWELEDASFLKFLQSTDGQKLIKGYENRLQRALEAPVLVDKSKVDPLVKLLELPAWSRHGTDITRNTVKKLHEYWYKGKNAVVFDEQERSLKIIFYILAMSNVSQPFFIITTSNSLSYWESEFSRLAPSTDILVYSGNKDKRKGIRTLEFYEKGNLIVFQVLLSTMEAVVEDLEMLQSQKWGSVIVDECQSPEISRHFEQIKTLSTDSKVLIFSGPIKEAFTEYQNLISFLDSHVNLANNEVSRIEWDGNLDKLKERMNDYIAYRCKFSKFVEYWLPVQLSKLQLEQYCSILLSSSIALCSCSKNDIVGALRETLISTRKCCDHPYLLDPRIQPSLTKDLQPIEYLDVGIKASGKLQLLDLILSELKIRRFRVVIYFQYISGPQRDSIGDILDDFVRQRFGPDSYQRVDAWIKTAKKHEAVNNFNKKDSSQFIFLLENRACHPNIKLSSVDAVVIFTSDTMPSNDLKALQRIYIESSRFKQIKVFRLYSAFTVEEKSLILAKKNHTFDSNDSKRGLSDTLLMWGASYLFASLDEFYRSNVADISSEPLVLNTVVKELVDLLSDYDASQVTTNNPLNVKVEHLTNGGYSTSLSLHGELKIRMTDTNPPHLFWSNLLEGRNYTWKFLPVQNQRQRKRVQHFSELPQKQGVENEVGKKRKKVVSQARPALEGTDVDDGFHLSPKSVAHFTDTLDVGPASKLPVCDERPHSELPKSPHLPLKPDLSRLFGILKLPENVKHMVGMFLDYVVDNLIVSREPESIFQAFQISMCWIGASLLKHKIDRKESLALAKEHLQFICKEEQAESVYAKLKLLKKDFFSKDPKLYPEEANSKQPSNALVSGSKLVERPEMVVSDLVNTVERKCEKRMAKLIKKQHHEVLEFHKTWDDKMLHLEKRNKMESALVRELHPHNNSTKLNKLRGLEEELKKKREEHDREKDACLKDFKAKHLQERNDEKERMRIWVGKAKSCVNGTADIIEEIQPPGTTESVLLEVPDAVINLSDDFEPVESGNVAVESNRDTDKNDEANSSNTGDSPSILDLPLVQPVISLTPEGPLSQEKVCQDGSRPLDSTQVHDGSAAPAEATPSSVPSGNVDVVPLSRSESLILQRSEPDTSPELERPRNVAQNFANVTPSSGTIPCQSLAGNLAMNEAGSGSTPQFQSRQQATAHVTSRPLYDDSLQNELERIRRDTKQTIKSHEDTKSKLKSDCEKEIEEMIAQIRRKYEIKLGDAEVVFEQKMKELGDNEIKVSKNKCLAAAFRSKCINITPTTQRQAGPPGLMQQLRDFVARSSPQVPAGTSVPLLSNVRNFIVGSPAVVNRSSLVPPPATQLTAPSAPRSVLVSGPSTGPPAATQSSVHHTPQSSAGPPAATQSTVPSTPRGLGFNSSTGPTQLLIPSSPRVLGVSGSLADPTTQLADLSSPKVSGVTSTSTGPPLATRQNPLPALQIVNQSAALFSCPPTRPVGGGGKIRAPAPHLQHFRPPPVSTPSVTTLLHSMPGPHTPNAVRSSTSSFAHRTPQPPPPLLPPQVAPSLTTQTPLVAPSLTTPMVPIAPPLTTPMLPVALPLTTPTTPIVPPLTIPTPPVASPLTTPTAPIVLPLTTPTAPIEPPLTTPMPPVVLPLTTPMPPVVLPLTTPMPPVVPSLTTPTPPIVPPLTTQPAPPPQIEAQNTTLSALELLMGMDTGPSSYPSNILPPLPDFDAPLDLSEFGPPFGTQLEMNDLTLPKDNIH